MKDKKISIALIGFGYWGKNLFRVLLTHKDFSFHHCVDISFKKRKKESIKGHLVWYENDPRVIFSDPTIDAVVVATPFPTHYLLAKEALKSKKHVLIEKPMVGTEQEAKELISSASEEKKVLMVDHTFLYDDAILLMKKYIQSPAFGKFEALYAIREQYGPFRKGESVIWDLGIHDVTIARFFLDGNPISVDSQNNYISGFDKPVSSQFHLKFPKDRHVFVRVSWISPERRRELLVIGTKKIIQYNQSQPDMFCLYKRGNLSLLDREEIHFSRNETLVSMFSHFASSISHHSYSRSDGKEGFEIIRILKKLDLAK